MGQRLALKTKPRDEQGDKVMFFSDMEEFVRRGKEFGFGPRSPIHVEIDAESKELLFWIPVPGKTPRMPDGRRRVVRRPTKKELAVKEQIEKHKENTKKGIKTKGHIPPVVKKKRVIKRKKKT